MEFQIIFLFLFRFIENISMKLKKMNISMELNNFYSNRVKKIYILIEFHKIFQ